MTDLDRLIAAVKAGTANDFRALLTEHDDAAERAKRCGWASSACKGNLNAAKQLHEALLPDHAWIVGCDQAVAWPSVLSIQPEWSRVEGIPARAWLLAILRALKAREAA